MADITVDVNLPNPITVDVTSPTQASSTNISIPGPQGPRGEKGNPTSINSLTAENIIITGADGNIVYNSGLNTIFISGNSGYFQSAVNSLTTNLNSTGANLNTSINNLSGLFTGYTGSLDATYATDSQLNSTGNTLNIKIDNLSGYVNSQDSNISNNLASTGSSLQSNIDTLSSNLNSTGNILNSNINSLSGTLTSNYATITNLASTGSTLSNNINSLSGTLTSSYATITNLASTGSTLTSSINSLNSAFTGFTGNLDASYATDLQLSNTGITLNNSITSLSGTLTGNYVTKSNGQFIDRPTVNSLGIALQNDGILTKGGFESFDVNTNGIQGYFLAKTTNGTDGNIGILIYEDDEVTLSGYSLLGVRNGDGFLQSKSSNFRIETFGGGLGNLNAAGAEFDNTPTVNGNPVLTGVDLSSYATITNLASTGSTLANSINSLSGTLTSTYATISNLASTGSNLQTQINNLDNVYATDTSVTNVSNNLASTGSILDTKINSLSGSSVLLYGNQSVGGIKTFRDNVYINNLFVTGTETIVSTNNFNVQSPYVLLNLTGGAVDGGIFFVTGSGLTGVNDTGPIIGFDHSTKFKFGFSTRNSDLSTLPDIASVQDIIAYSGVADNKFSTITNLASTGNTLEGKISSLSGTLTSNYATISNLASTGSTLVTNLASTGSTLNSSINSLSGTLTSTYATITNLASTGSTLVSSINSLSGTLTSTYATITNLASTGSTLVGSINSLSGTLTSTYATITNLASTGSTLNTRINTLSGYINSTSSNIVFTTGNQTISGIKTFAENTTFGDTGQGDFLVISGNNFTVYGSGNFTSGLFVNSSPVLTGSSTLYATTVNLASTGSTLQTNINNLSGYINSSSSNIVFTTGNQTISGNKTFIGVTTLSGTDGGFIGGEITLVGGSGVGFGGGINLNGGIGGFGGKGTISVKGQININRAENINNSTDFYKSGDAGTPYLSITKDQINITNGAALLVSGVAVTPALYVNTTTNQTISGLKTFTNTGTFNSGIDLNNSNLINATPQIINLSANFNISGNYNSRMIMVNSATEVTGRIVSGNSLGFNATIMQVGSGQVLITGSGIGITIGSYNNQYKTAGKFAAVSVLHTGSNGYLMYGNTSL